MSDLSSGLQKADTANSDVILSDDETPGTQTGDDGPESEEPADDEATQQCDPEFMESDQLGRSHLESTT